MVHFFIALPSIVSTTSLAIARVRASKVLFEQAFKSVMKSHMSFFNVKPVGQMLNRLGKDIDIIDNVFPPIFNKWKTRILTVLKLVPLCDQMFDV